MIVGEIIKEKEFSSKSMKEAYLDACKWVSTNILATNNSENIAYTIRKIKSKDFGVKKVKLTLYVIAEEEQVNERNCEICMEASSLFYMKQNKYKCESCGIKPYRERMKERLRLLREGLKGVVL